MTACTVDATSVAAVMAGRMAERLRLYRDCVARVARGEAVQREDADELRRVMPALGLPSFAFRRDVEAVRGLPRLCSHRRRELAINHPHLFDDPETWVQERVQAASRTSVANHRTKGARQCR